MNKRAMIDLLGRGVAAALAFSISEFNALGVGPPIILDPIRALFADERQLARAMSGYGIMMGMAAAIRGPYGAISMLKFSTTVLASSFSQALFNTFCAPAASAASW